MLAKHVLPKEIWKINYENGNLNYKGNDHLIEFHLIKIVIFQLIESFNNELIHRSGLIHTILE